jgi:hypothetical protein
MNSSSYLPLSLHYLPTQYLEGSDTTSRGSHESRLAATSQTSKAEWSTAQNITVALKTSVDGERRPELRHDNLKVHQSRFPEIDEMDKAFWFRHRKKRNLATSWQMTIILFVPQVGLMTSPIIAGHA